MILAILLMLLGAFTSYAQGKKQEDRPLSVCELIAHREEYNEKLVTVRGEVEVGEGAWLDAGPDCKYQLVTKGVVWPIAIWLAYPNNRSIDPMDHADFGIDWRAEKAVNAIFTKLGFDPEKDHLYETFVGLFRTYLDLDKRVNPNHQDWPRLGFGHLNAAPAQLLMKIRKDLIVVHGPSGNK